jgi:hypothetical protein
MVVKAELVEQKPADEKTSHQSEKLFHVPLQLAG